MEYIVVATALIGFGFAIPDKSVCDAAAVKAFGNTQFIYFRLTFVLMRYASEGIASAEGRVSGLVTLDANFTAVDAAAPNQSSFSTASISDVFNTVSTEYPLQHI